VEVLEYWIRKNTRFHKIPVYLEYLIIINTWRTDVNKLTNKDKIDIE